MQSEGGLATPTSTTARTPAKKRRAPLSLVEPTPARKLRIERRFTHPETGPFGGIEFEVRTAAIYKSDGSKNFEMVVHDIPVDWDQSASDILASKYLRKAGVPQYDSDGQQLVDEAGASVLGAETSAKQWALRLANAWRIWGERESYFETAEDAEAYRDEMAYMLLAQMGSPNSPQHFNSGLFEAYGIVADPEGNWYYDPTNGETRLSPHRYFRSAVSACYIVPVSDELVGEDSIFDLWEREARLFKAGSGVGTNFSHLRAKGERLSGGGTSSGVMSFLRVGDRAAGSIRSGGTTRRAAKMVVLDVTHPEIEEFVRCKVIEEQKAAALIAGGFSADWTKEGGAYDSVSYQNANHSVRVSDKFLEAATTGEDWSLIARTTGEVLKTVKARDLWEQIAQAAWACADPGVQFDDTINGWNTAAGDGRLRATNPCFPASARVHTDRGLIRIGELVERVAAGESFHVWTHNSTNPSTPNETVSLSHPSAFMATGIKEIVRLIFVNGMELRCTPNHRIFTTNRGMVEARDLTAEDRVKVGDLAMPPVLADLQFRTAKDSRVQPGAVVASRYMAKKVATRLPEKWSPEVAHLFGWLSGDGSISDSGSNTACVWVYGTATEQEEVLPVHQHVLAGILGHRPEPVRAANGTLQLRAHRRPLLDFLYSLGFSDANAPIKRVPEAVFHAPPEILAAYLRGLFDADGTVVALRNATRYVGLSSASLGMLRDVQKLLAAFGVSSRIYNTRQGGREAFTYTTTGGEARTYLSSAEYSLRITAKAVSRFAAHVGFSLSSKAAKLSTLDHSVRGFYETDTTTTLQTREDCGAEPTINLTEQLNHTYVVDGIVVANCGESTHLDNTACNLASLNLVRFYDDATGVFDADAFAHAVRLWTITLEISVAMSHYPSAVLARNSSEHRPLGLGYCNLGALLMRAGLAYDDDAGRAVMAGLTALMHDLAYTTSSELAAAVGPCVAYERNADHMERVIRNHARAAFGSRIAESDLDGYEGLHIVPQGVDHTALRETPFAHLSDAVIAAATDMLAGRELGRRNMQVTVIAPTGTISLVMGADTTGVEPDFALVKHKKLAGGGYMKIVNGSVTSALRRLGYTEPEIGRILVHALGTATLEGPTAVNRGALMAKGLPEAAVDKVEAELPRAVSLEAAFAPHTVGPENLVLLGVDLHAIESPDFSLLRHMGFTDAEIQGSSLTICGHQTVEGAPDLHPEHLSVFDTAIYCGDGTRTISWEGHVKALGAVAPHLSGSASKTVNLPNKAIIDDVRSCYELAYKLGVKAVSVYRDGSKLSQVLTSSQTKEGPEVAEAVREVTSGMSPTEYYHDATPPKFKLPEMAWGPRWKFNVGGTEVFLRAGQYPDGTLGEIFIDLSKEGSTIKGILSCFAMSVSHGLQYGVPLEKLVEVFIFHNFAPQGAVAGHKNLKMATSIVDAIFRILAFHYLDRGDLVQVAEPQPTRIGVEPYAGTLAAIGAQRHELSPPIAQPEARHASAPHGAGQGVGSGQICTDCGGEMVRSGTCYRCTNCGATTGCG